MEFGPWSNREPFHTAVCISYYTNYTMFFFKIIIGCHIIILTLVGLLLSINIDIDININVKLSIATAIAIAIATLLYTID